MASSEKKYTTLVNNTLLFALSNFSSKLLRLFIRPYLSYALDSPDVMGVSSLLQQATNLLIPVVSLGVSYAVIRFGLDKAVRKDSVFVNGGVTILAGFCHPAGGHAAGAADPQRRRVPALAVPLRAGQLSAHFVHPVHPGADDQPAGGGGRRHDHRRAAGLLPGLPELVPHGGHRFPAGQRLRRPDLDGLCLHRGRVLAVLQAQSL